MTLNAFASVRFTGDKLEPSLLSDIIRVRPTLSYHKGETFQVGESQTLRVGRTGLWLLNTEGRADPHDLDAHIIYAFNALIGSENKHEAIGRAVALRSFVLSNDLNMRLSLFWHGSSGEPEPVVREGLRHFVDLLGGQIETDFDRQSDGSTPSPLVAA